jgi:hypothetical protein
MDINQIKEGAGTLEELAEFDFNLPEEKVEETKKEIPDLDFTVKEGEEEPEDKEEEEEAPEVKKEKPTPNTSSKKSDYTNLAKKLIERGDWADAEIVNEDGTKILLSEMEGMDEGQYLEILENQKNFKDEELKEKYTSVEGLDEHKKRLINIIKEGGDLKELFQDPNSIQRPFEGIDLDDENTCANIVFRQHLANGLDEKEATELTRLAQKEFSLDEKAKKIVDYHQSTFDKSLETKEKEVQASRLKEQADLKNYRSALSKSYKEQGLQETLSKKLIDLATREDKEGVLEVDNLYEAAMQDPETARELIHFLGDKASYLKLKAVDSKRKDNIETLKTISFIQKDKNKKVSSNTDDGNTPFDFDLPTR